MSGSEDVGDRWLVVEDGGGGERDFGRDEAAARENVRSMARNGQRATLYRLRPTKVLDSLGPCPFCGGPGVEHENKDYWTEDADASYGCESCGIWFDTPELWNRRKSSMRLVMDPPSDLARRG